MCNLFEVADVWEVPKPSGRHLQHQPDVFVKPLARFVQPAGVGCRCGGHAKSKPYIPQRAVRLRPGAALELTGCGFS